MPNSVIYELKVNNVLSISFFFFYSQREGKDFSLHWFDRLYPRPGRQQHGVQPSGERGQGSVRNSRRRMR